ncbi:MAG: translational GTPase TypA [Spirochaetales bacterium]|nr:translational GTPase TypA [Spirochaetales bacterium]MCF7938826.1 translational GTPase TypA [Spirochaetales bacterium]
MPHRDAHNETLRNIAIIAHVDHGKTTLVDAMFQQSGTFREGKETAERLMDSMELEKERGITIAAKNCSINWKKIKINILDTPGHADFGGEVERALSMVDGAILLVDASEGPLPQTRFVLSKALDAGLKIIVVINKIDRGDARPLQVVDDISDLLIELDATDEQLDYPLFFAIGKDGIAKTGLEDESSDLQPLFEAITNEIPAPAYESEAPFQMLVSDLSYSDFLGHLAIGKVINGSAKSKDNLVCLGENGRRFPMNVSRLQVYTGPVLSDASEAKAGDIVVLSGVEEVHIGDTICTSENPRPLPRISVDQPTVSMRFTANNSPFAGTEGRYVQAGKLADRLERETLRNVSLQVEPAEDGDGFTVKGRGEFQLAILIETMRREGYELCVGRPEVIYREENGKRTEPIELLSVDCEEHFAGVVTEKLSGRKGRMVSYVNHESGRVRLEFNLPSRALIGYRDEFLTDTRGTGIMNSYLLGYEEYRGEFSQRFTGSLVSDRRGEAVAYALFNLEPRGVIFVVPGERVYEGMIVGEHNRENDLDVNPCKEKKLSNMRAAGKDDNIILSPVLPMTLERAIQFIREDEMVEITPRSIRLRKRILQAAERKVAAKRKG